MKYKLKICPLFMSALISKDMPLLPKYLDNHVIYCKENKCGWYSENTNDCAMQHIKSIAAILNSK